MLRSGTELGFQNGPRRTERRPCDEHPANSEVASALFLTEATVKTHVTHILTKLDLAIASKPSCRVRVGSCSAGRASHPTGHGTFGLVGRSRRRRRPRARATPFGRSWTRPGGPSGARGRLSRSKVTASSARGRYACSSTDRSASASGHRAGAAKAGRLRTPGRDARSGLSLDRDPGGCPGRRQRDPLPRHRAE
ncbi:MAG: LuxR C-terminal-related transcriptional regulator [Actinomycetota bacterium]|nr:LuxR C-terminal-related transcriptional regulator [Actinomycetota bacterium]